MCGAPVFHSEQHGFSVLLRPDPAGKGPTSISIRHASRPYVINNIGAPSTLTSALITRMMQEYLLWLSGLSEAGQAPGIGFRYEATAADGAETLDVLRYSENHDAWCTSYDFARALPVVCGTENASEHTLIMLAAAPVLTRIDQAGQGVDATTDVSYQHRRGVRIVAHVDAIQNAPDEEQRYRLRITSMSAYLRQAQAVTLGKTMEFKDCCKAGGAAGCLNSQGNGINYAREPASSPETGMDGVDRTLNGRRPSRSSSVLNQYLGARGQGGTLTIEGCECLSCDDGNKSQPLHYLKLHRSPFVTEDIKAVRSKDVADAAIAKHPLPVPAAAPSVRTNAAAQLKAYCNTNQLFEHLVNFGIHPERYFASAELPLDVHYRSGMPYGPGKDGQTVNAAVQPDGWRRHQIAPTFCQSPPKLNVHYALADLSRRDRKVAEDNTGQRPPGRVPAIPLSVANDPRWVWHEIGHILLMATTGELEMRFSHSIGDALAAITGDPESAFVPDTQVDPKFAQRLKDRGCDDIGKRNRRWRGATFPWVFLPRRHDRLVTKGWSWTGAMHQPLLELPDAKQPRRKGYRSEQILSTSLFRLYLCLGGATPNSDPDGAKRRLAASEYVVYLIVKALGLLGDARIVPANHPDQLVSALIDADIGTQCFETTGGEVFYGGFAHKAIRWAFEAQGLYGTGDVTALGLGKPSAVDIYIEDGRPLVERWLGGGSVKHQPGAYVPVALSAPDCEGQDAEAQPEWVSRNGEGITVDANAISVAVGNRGQLAASGVTVKLSVYECDDSGLPNWDAQNTDWREIDSLDAEDVAAETSVTVGPFAWEPEAGTTYLIVAQASCPDDRASIDVAAMLPCSAKPMPLPLLIANDNNISLTVWKNI